MPGKIHKLSERGFREGTVLPFLKTLHNVDYTPIQQVSHCGDPDYILCLSGRFIGLELKAEKGVPSKLQVYKLSCILDAGGYAFVVRPSDWANVKETLWQLSQGNDLIVRHSGFEPMRIFKPPLKPRKRKLTTKGENHD